ncbi:MAG: sigma-70 family RNA polymerase sigma factor [Microbacteriaceae bacterium]|nr:sigma-70 family RNA polymerase sigma factor [Microbacteriaceae bacterium]
MDTPAQGSAADWSIAQLSAIYTEHRTQLVSQARRISKNEAEAHEIVQEAFLKFMLAAPDLDSADRAIAYLRTSVNNLALNVIRARGARPNLVAIDADTTQERLNEIASENHIDLDTTITAAEDAAIIREALSRLTPDQRTALVMWEMEGRTTEEIASALNTTPANVRHILGRARKSMVRVLDEWIVDEKTGLTALNALSTTYKKAAEIAQKSSKAALSLLLVVTAFLGFNSMTGNESPVLPVAAEVSTTAPAAESAAPTATASATAKAAATAAAKKAQQAAIYAKIAALSFVGLDKDGIPTGFSVTDKGLTTVGTSGLLINNQFITGSVGPNVLIDQLITVDGTGTNYSVNNVNIGFGGNWRSVEVKSTDTSIDRLANGNYLITATTNIGYLKTSDFTIPTGARGYDLTDAPATITTRVLLNSGKTQVLAQAVQVKNK